MKPEEVVEELRSWRLRELVKRAEDPGVFSIILEALKKRDPQVQKNALYIIKKLAQNKKLRGEDAERAVKSVMRLIRSKDEGVALQAIMALNTILSTTELSSETYSEAADVLMELTSSGKVLLSEYAAEGLGNVGARILTLARRILSWVLSIVGGERSPEVKAVTMEVLSTIVEKTEDPRILEEGLNTALKLLEEEDPHVRNIARDIVDKALQRGEMLSIEVIQNASDALERAEKISPREHADETPGSPVGVEEPVADGEEHTVDSIKRMFEMEKHPYVLELARRDYGVLRLVMRIFLSEDLIHRVDALWVLSNAASYIKLDDALELVPVLEEMARSDNPWIRSTSIKLFGTLATDYPSIMEKAVEFVLSALDSGEPSRVKGALELFDFLTSRVENLGLLRSVVEKTLPLLENSALRDAVVDFLRKHEDKIEGVRFRTKKEDCARPLKGSLEGKTQDWSRMMASARSPPVSSRAFFAVS